MIAEVLSDTKFSTHCWNTILPQIAWHSISSSIWSEVISKTQISPRTQNKRAKKVDSIVRNKWECVWKFKVIINRMIRHNMAVHAISNTSYIKTLAEFLHVFSKVVCSANIPLSEFFGNSFDVNVIHMTYLKTCKNYVI